MCATSEAAEVESMLPTRHVALSRLFILVIVIACLNGCSRQKNDEGGGANQSTLQKAIATKKIRIGFANEAPFAYQEAATGKLTGESPEVARVVLSRLGIYEVEGVLTEFGSLIPGLQAGRFDIIAAGMYILPERCAQIAFSNPTYSVGEAFAVRTENPLSLHSYQDVISSQNAKLGVVSGAIESSYASKLGVPQDRIIFLPDPPSALEALGSGRIDAYAATRLTIMNLLQKSGAGVELAAPFEDPVVDGRKARGYGAFGFRKGDRDLVEAFNAQLRNFIGTREHLLLVHRFGFDEYDMPGNVTAEELCQSPQGAPK